MSNKHLTDTKFSSLGLPVKLLDALTQEGLEFCTPIQEITLPLSLAGKDVSGQAQTGTGKTISFLLALFTRLINNPPAENTGLRALVIAPTRELAFQIHEDAVALNKHLDYKIGLAYGGKDYQKQRDIISSGIDILIGTPGRIIDYMKQGVFSVDHIEVMVLDEADRMFDLGFISDIRFIFRRLPEPTKRLNMLFSATFSFRVHELAYEHMNNPETIKIESENITAEQIKESIYYPAMEEKIPLLITLLNKVEATRVLVFVNTKYEGEKICQTLLANNFKAGVLSGDVQQSKREQLLNKFKEGEVTVMVATDVAARGLHIPDVSHVFNYDLPHDCEDYVHRIGRTARAGAKGEAISFACEQYAITLPDIEAYIGHKIESLPIIASELGEYIKPDRPVRSKFDKSRNKKPDRKPQAKTTKHEDKPDLRPEPETKTKQLNQAQIETKVENIALSDEAKATMLKERLFSKRGYEIPAVG